MKKLLVLFCVVLIVTLLPVACTKASPTPAPPPPAASKPETTAAAPPPTTAAPAAPSPTASKPATTTTAAPSPAPSAAPKTVVTLKAVTFADRNNTLSLNFFVPFTERVKALSNGELVINWIGGPEAVPTMDQPTAVKNGVVDMSFTWPPAYPSLVPCPDASSLSQITPQEERTNGFYDFYNDLHKKAGFFYLGRAIVHPATFYTFTQVKVSKPQELAKLKCMPSGKALPVAEALGMTVVNVKREEVYTAVERGMLDSFMFPLVGFTSSAWQEVTKFMIDHPFMANNTLLIINLNKWNQLPERLQNVLNQAIKEVEKDSPALYDKLSAKETEPMKKAGMQFIKFSDADAKSYLDTAYSAAWKKATEKDPVTGAKFIEYLSKKK